MNGIKALRKKYGMTQKEFASDLNIPIGTVRNWEQGISKCPTYVYQLIAGKLMK